VRDHTQAGTSGAAASAAGKPTAAGRALLGINLEALDGTAGRQGPRQWNDTEEAKASPGSFPDTTAQLTPEERETYR